MWMKLVPVSMHAVGIFRGESEWLGAALGPEFHLG